MRGPLVKSSNCRAAPATDMKCATGNLCFQGGAKSFETVQSAGELAVETPFVFVQVHSGFARSQRGAGGRSKVASDLIAQVQVLLERDELGIARKMPDAGSLERELLDMQSTTTSSGRRRLGADGYGQHDDLVIALALACWRARRSQIGHGLAPLPGVVW
jgi:hypothetical protein